MTSIKISEIYSVDCELISNSSSCMSEVSEGELANVFGGRSEGRPSGIEIIDTVGRLLTVRELGRLTLDLVRSGPTPPPNIGTVKTNPSY